jgi:simple sugar transport system ATP-binding protein
MTVAENLLLARPALPAVIRWFREFQALEAFMATMPFKVDLSAWVHTLAAGEKQKVELLKQLYLDRQLLILDEPTSVLTPAEADEVLGLLHTMTRQGRVTEMMIGARHVPAAMPQRRYSQGYSVWPCMACRP